jgi:hypothetical protein
MRRGVLGVLFLLLASSQAAAWYDIGHKIVLELAFRLAEPETRAEFCGLIQRDRQYDFFRGVCTKPGHPRERASEYFVGPTRNATELTSGYCLQADKCTLRPIASEVEVFFSPVGDDRKLRLSSSSVTGSPTCISPFTCPARVIAAATASRRSAGRSRSMFLLPFRRLII